MSMINPWDFWIMTIGGSDARDNTMFYPPKKTMTSQHMCTHPIHLKFVWLMCLW